MKQKITLTLIFFCAALNVLRSQSAGTVKDIDGRMYNTVQIGAQRWMTENLGTARCSDGSAIPAGNFRADAGKYLYNMGALEACNICPDGWRIPERTDITDLNNSPIAGTELQKLLNINKEGFLGVDYMMLRDIRLYHADFRRNNRNTEFTVKAENPSQFGIVRCVQDILSTPAAYRSEPKLFATGDEGQRNASEIDAGTEIRLEVVFIDWSDKPAKSKDSAYIKGLWNVITNGNKRAEAFNAQGATLHIHLNYTWKRMPNPSGYYFPKDTDPGHWKWEEYTRHSLALADRSTSYPANTIAVIIPDSNALGLYKAVPSGAHGGGARGIRKMITAVPQIYKEHYTTLMHEIGHCFGSDELYPDAEPYQHEVGGYDVMGDIVYATGFLGWHRYRYGWLSRDRIQYLKDKGTYAIDLVKLSATSGKSMIVIPDKEKASKYWVIEIGQDVVSRSQFYAKKGEKLNTEGERLIIYTVEEPAVSGKRAIRLVPRTEFSNDHGTVKWLDAVSYKAGQSSTRADMPFQLRPSKRTGEGFVITVSLK